MIYDLLALPDENYMCLSNLCPYINYSLLTTTMLLPDSYMSTYKMESTRIDRIEYVN